MFNCMNCNCNFITRMLFKGRCIFLMCPQGTKDAGSDCTGIHSTGTVAPPNC